VWNAVLPNVELLEGRAFFEATTTFALFGAEVPAPAVDVLVVAIDFDVSLRAIRPDVAWEDIVERWIWDERSVI